jgi:autophagy-related protein 11
VSWTHPTHADRCKPVLYHRLRVLTVSAISDLSQAQQPFLIAFDHLAHLHSLFTAQSRAVSIAYANLSHHLAPLMREFESFAMRAEREMQVEEGLIRSAKADLAMLPKVLVHETFLRKKEGMDGSQLPKTLADYVHPRKMEQVRESCQVAHGGSQAGSTSRLLC